MDLHEWKATPEAWLHAEILALARRANFLNAALPNLLNPLALPGSCLKGIRKTLCFVDDLAIAELSNTHCVSHRKIGTYDQVEA